MVANRGGPGIGRYKFSRIPQYLNCLWPNSLRQLFEEGDASWKGQWNRAEMASITNAYLGGMDYLNGWNEGFENFGNGFLRDCGAMSEYIF